MKPPPLLSERPPAVRVVLASVVPLVFGAICGVLLGISEPAYLVLSVLAIGGGYFAGLEHPTAREGAVRGTIGGMQFGAMILLVHELTGKEAKVHLPDPAILLVVLTTVLGIALGYLGGRSRAKRSARR